MHFGASPIAGSWLIDLDRHADDRGSFARAYCERELHDHGVDITVRQVNLSQSHRAGTLRGMHFQFPPAAETKIVRCIAGAIHDVVVDLRPESQTFLRHHAARLDADNGTAMVVPERCAHGFITLEDDAKVLYLHSEFYTPAEEGGLAFDDPMLSIRWPRDVTVASARDRNWPGVDGRLDDLRRRMALSVPC